MARRRRRRARAVLLVTALAVIVAAVVWASRTWLPQWRSQPIESAPQTAAAAPGPVETRKIQATLFYVSADGMRLAAVQREIPYGEGAAEQARQILRELLQPPPSPYKSAIPAGTRLREVFFSGRGEAFVDLSREIGIGHVGGSLTEAFTVYAIVNTLTTNLPAVTGVQILVEGQEVDTLAGHIDTRHPLRKNLRWVQKPETP
jgi:spore germination protein GerM